MTQRYLREKYLAEVNVLDQTIDMDMRELMFLKELNEIIELNIDDQDIGALATKQLGTNLPNLNRRIKILTGLSISEYVLKYKLNKARMLLLKQNMTASEVAYAVGLSAAKNFPTIFRNEFGNFPIELEQKNE